MDLRKASFYIIIILIIPILVLFTYNTSYLTNFHISMSHNVQGKKSPVPDEGLRLCDQTTRTNHLKQQCIKHLKSSSRRQNGYIVVVKKYKTVFCVPRKAGSSTINTMLFKLSGDFNVSNDLPGDANIHHPEHWERHGIRNLISYNKREWNKILNTYYKVLVVRHPLDRLYSAYNDKFLYDKLYQPYNRPFAIDRFRHGITNRSLAYYAQFFPKELYESANYKKGNLPIELAIDKASKLSAMEKKYMYYLPPFSSDDPHKPTFQEFLQFVLMTNANDRHWMPAVDFCDPCNVHYDYIAKVETLSRDSEHILQNIARIQAIPSGLRLEHKNNLRHRHSSSNRISKHLPLYNQVSPPIMQRIMKMYKYDMDYFGYDYNKTNAESFCLCHRSNGENCC